MIYYAYLKQRGEGCDYTIGCAQTLIKINANSDDEAKQKLKEQIKENYTGEYELESVLLFNSKIDFNLSEVYSELKRSKNEEKEKLQHIKDLEDFDKLRKKLGK